MFKQPFFGLFKTDFLRPSFGFNVACVLHVQNMQQPNSAPELDFRFIYGVWVDAHQKLSSGLTSGNLQKYI